MFDTVRSWFSRPTTAVLPAQAAPAAPIAHVPNGKPQLELVPGEQPAPTVTTTLAASIYTLIDAKNNFRYGAIFRYNRLTVKNLKERQSILLVIRNSERVDFMALPFERRKRVFALLKQETARYNGTAVRQATSRGGKAGEPLPKLEFPTPQDAAAYRDLLQAAYRRIANHVYG